MELINIKRYGPCISEKGFATMHRIDNGDWVKFSDIKELLKCIDPSSNNTGRTYEWRDKTLDNLNNKNQEKKVDANYAWHLPSKEVLSIMFQNRKKISGFVSCYYWSSSEHSSNYAWKQYFHDGYQGYGSKDIIERVRAVRALPSDTELTQNVIEFAGDLYEVYPEDAPKEMNWEDAMEWCESLNESERGVIR